MPSSAKGMAHSAGEVIVSTKCQICLGQHLTQHHDIATGCLKEPDYERYGEEWEKEMERFSKKQLILWLKEKWQNDRKAWPIKMLFQEQRIKELEDIERRWKNGEAYLGA